MAKALVYTKEEHGIDRSRIDPEAARILEHLRNNGHDGYIVGGAVRDLLLGRTPKDFDLVTDAQPSRIRRLFRNSRVIGRRFRLVHVYSGKKIFELSTFRSIAGGTVGNEFGTMDEDALRRDFTFNALYYSTHDDTLVDYVGGLEDIRKKRVRPVIPLESIFREDPVRMLRCVKYASASGFRIPFRLRFAIRRESGLLADASPSRLSEEFSKILVSGHASTIVEALLDYDLLRHILPELHRTVKDEPRFRQRLVASLEELDALPPGPEGPRRLAQGLAHVLKPRLESGSHPSDEGPEAFRIALHESRLFLAPLCFPRVELEASVSMAFGRSGVVPARRIRRETASPAPAGARRRAPRAHTA